MQVGDKIRWEHFHIMQTVRFTTRIYKIENGRVFCRVSDRVANLPFPPFNGARRFSLPIENVKPETVISI
jgi:hypothetical protein